VRPEWANLLQGLRGTFEVDGNIDHAFSALRDRLDREEARQPKLLGRATTQAPAVFAARTPAAAQPNTCSVAEQLAKLEQQLQEVRASAAQGSSQAAMGQRRLPRSAITQQALDSGNCLRCNSALHKVDQCTAPFSSSGTLRVNTACATSSGWMLDSGCTHDMHSGGGQGAGMFANYHKFDEPVLVHFGKRGVTAPALGRGTLVIEGGNGALCLPDVLHVPELDHPLFSVKAALRRGMWVHLVPSSLPGDTELAVVMQGQSVLLTATPRGDLFFINERVSPSAAAALLSNATLAGLQSDHRRLGHIGYDTLADLCRRGMLTGDGRTPAAYLQAPEQLGA
jgi:hypothetical protein